MLAGSSTLGGSAVEPNQPMFVTSRPEGIDREEERFKEGSADSVRGIVNGAKHGWLKWDSPLGEKGKSDLVSAN